MDAKFVFRQNWILFHKIYNFFRILFRILGLLLVIVMCVIVMQNCNANNPLPWLPLGHFCWWYRDQGLHADGVEDSIGDNNQRRVSVHVGQWDCACSTPTVSDTVPWWGGEDGCALSATFAWSIFDSLVDFGTVYVCMWLTHITCFCLPFLFVFFLLPFLCVLPSLLSLLLSLTFQNMDPLRFQAGGRRRRPNPGLVCFVLMFAVFLVKDACLFSSCRFSFSRVMR